MNRAEAEKLVGKRVRAWTAMNGVYTGTLVAVIPAGKWRGVVKIDGVVEAAVPYETGRFNQRRGMRPGQEIEVGGCNIAACDDAGTSYLDALLAQRAAFQRHIQNATRDSDRVTFTRSIGEIDRRIAEESA